MTAINTKLSPESWCSFMDFARGVARKEKPKRAHARCEQCHRIVLLPHGEEDKINPDWWFCEECRGDYSDDVGEEAW